MLRKMPAMTMTSGPLRFDIDWKRRIEERQKRAREKIKATKK